MVTVGEELQMTRMQKGFTINRIELVTHIKKKYIVALEEDDYGSFADMTYAIAYLKTYSRYLELDENRLIKEYRKESGYSGNSNEYLVDLYDQESRGKLRNYQMIFFIVGILILMGSLSYFGTRDWGISEIIIPDEIVFDITTNDQ